MGVIPGKHVPVAQSGGEARALAQGEIALADQVAVLDGRDGAPGQDTGPVDAEVHDGAGAVVVAADGGDLSDAYAGDAHVLTRRQARDVLEDSPVGEAVAEGDVGDGGSQCPERDDRDEGEDDQLDQARGDLHVWFTVIPRSMGPASSVVMAEGPAPASCWANSAATTCCSPMVPAPPESAPGMP